MKYLVIGGAGYIGSVTVRRLLQAGHDVVVLDDLSTGHRAAVSAGAILVEGSYGNAADLARALAHGPIDGVLHFGARSLVGDSVRDPVTYYEANIGAATTLVRGVLGAGIRSFVFSSTAAVYGEPQQVPITEGHRTVPTNPYGWTKLAVEQLLMACGRSHGLRSVCLRYFNAAGASGELGEDHAPETHLIPVLLRNALRGGEPVTVFGRDYPTHDGTCVRDYIHVDDLASAHLRALEYLDGGGASDVFNLGNGSGFSVLEVIHTVEEVTDRQVNWIYGERREGDPARLVASSQKAQQILGWVPDRVRLSDIAGSAWAWHQAHPEGYATHSG